MIEQADDDKTIILSGSDSDTEEYDDQKNDMVVSALNLF